MPLKESTLPEVLPITVPLLTVAEGLAARFSFSGAAREAVKAAKASKTDRMISKTYEMLKTMF